MNNKKKEKQVEFVGRIVRLVFSSEDYKMYGVEIDRDKYPDIKLTIYGTATIAGNLHSLTPGAEYYIVATEKNGSKGYLYNVTNIRKTDLKSEGDVYTFLQEIITFNQASELYREYPNIIDLVVNGEADEKVDLNKLHGIGPYTFNVIKGKIIENYALFDLINEFKGVLTISMLKKLYEKYPSIQKIRSEMKKDPYKCLCGLSRVGFKTADALLLEMEKEKIIEFEYPLISSKQRCLACMLYFLEENENNGNTKMSLLDLRKQVCKLTPGCSEHFVTCINEHKKEIFCNKKTMDIALQDTLDTELLIAGYINIGLSEKNVWNINWESYRDKGEFPLSDEQLKSLELICKENIVILCGYAGSGKTATTNTLIRMLTDNNKSFKLVSPTGRAAKVLSSYTGMPAYTIHRGYAYMPPEWGYNSENKVEQDIVIVDETSMCDVFLFYRLLDGIDFKRTKLFIIGDPAQLCSVGAGNVLHDLIESNIVPTVKLTKIFRYNEGGLMQVATDTRNGKSFLSDTTNGKFVSFGEKQDFIFFQYENNKILDRLEAVYEGLLESGISPNEIMVLSAQNKGDFGTIAINNRLQKLANENCKKNSSNFMQIGDTKYYVGDLVLQTVNNYHAKINNPLFSFDTDDKEMMIANGETMVIKEISQFDVILEIDNVEVVYKRADMQNVNLAYSISTHKSQGGSAKIVIFIVPTSHTFMLSSNLLYVGFTRTKERCFTIGDLTTVNRAIKKKEENNRNTFLLTLLKNLNKLYKAERN